MSPEITLVLFRVGSVIVVEATTLVIEFSLSAIRPVSAGQAAAKPS